MYLSEAFAAQERAQAAVQEAKDALYWAEQNLQETVEATRGATCDHPDTNGYTCAYCGVFHLSEESLQDMDDFNVQLADLQGLQNEGFPGSHTWGSHYYIFPRSRV